MSESYVPDVSMFPYWKNKDAGGLVKQVKELSAQVSQYKEQLEYYENDNVVFSKETVKCMKQGHQQLKNKVKKLVEEKQELEAKVDEAQVIFQENLKYSSEFEAIRRSIEEQCEAAGIMEVMNMRIEEAENKAREQELLKVIAETDLKKEKEKCKKFVNDCMKLRSVLFNQCDLDECECCGSWVDDNEMEEVKDYAWEDIRVCLNCRDDDFTQCDCCHEYVDLRYISTNETTGDEVCENCLNSDDED